MKKLEILRELPKYDTETGREQMQLEKWHVIDAEWASLVAQLVKNPPKMWETWVRSLGWEDPLEKRMATHFSILTWRIPWTEEPGRLQSVGSQRVGHN